MRRLLHITYRWLQNYLEQRKMMCLYFCLVEPNLKWWCERMKWMMKCNWPMRACVCKRCFRLIWIWNCWSGSRQSNSMFYSQQLLYMRKKYLFFLSQYQILKWCIRIRHRRVEKMQEKLRKKRRRRRRNSKPNWSENKKTAEKQK